jgi:hypothetical protein
LRATVLRDFIEILKELNIYSVEDHNKSEHIYTFPNGSIVEFFSVDDEQKIRGRKRDIAWCNEANELYFDDFTQLNMRTESSLSLTTTLVKAPHGCMSYHRKSLCSSSQPTRTTHSYLKALGHR